MARAVTRWERNVAAISLEDWAEAMRRVGIPNYIVPKPSPTLDDEAR
jgi:hypothetical protein